LIVICRTKGTRSSTDLITTLPIFLPLGPKTQIGNIGYKENIIVTRTGGSFSADKGYVGGYFQFDSGINQAYGNDWTVAFFWEHIGGTNQRAIITTLPTFPTNNEHVLHVWNWSNTGGNVCGSMYGTAAALRLTSGNSGVHHYALLSDKRVFVDGKYLLTVPDSGKYTQKQFSGIMFGRVASAGSESYSSPVSNLMIADRVLSEDEIRELHGMGRAPVE
jgi:hypothetical protein